MSRLTPAHILGACCLVGFDQLLKYILPIHFINTRLNVLILSVAVIVLVALTFITRSSAFRLQTTHYSLLTLMAGGAGNLLDRLIVGGVRDIWQLGSLYFNLADIYVVGGVLLLLLYSVIPPRPSNPTGL